MYLRFQKYSKFLLAICAVFGDYQSWCAAQATDNADITVDGSEHYTWIMEISPVHTTLITSPVLSDRAVSRSRGITRHSFSFFTARIIHSHLFIYSTSDLSQVLFSYSHSHQRFDKEITLHTFVSWQVNISTRRPLNTFKQYSPSLTQDYVCQRTSNSCS